MTLGGGTSCIFSSFKEKGLGGFAERFHTLAVVLLSSSGDEDSPFIRAVHAMQGSRGWRRSAVLPGRAVWSLDSREGGAWLQGGSRPGSLHSVKCSRCPIAPLLLNKTVLKVALS